MAVYNDYKATQTLGFAITSLSISWSMSMGFFDLLGFLDLLLPTFIVPTPQPA